MIRIDDNLKPTDLVADLRRFWQVSGEKILLIEREYDPKEGAPVFTAAGKYRNRGWTDWTQGFQYGSALLQFDAVGEALFLTIGRENTLTHMTPHLTHFGVHDHGFNVVSTYGNLLRLVLEGKALPEETELCCRTALKVSAAVQAHRWTSLPEGGYIYSFNGPHSLFVDTIRSCRSLVIGELLGQALHGEGGRRISLLDRAVQHMLTTASFSVYYGEGRDIYDVRGRTAHESIFNINDGSYRCPNSQQGYSPFSTWMRGLSWAMLGFAEELEIVPILLRRRNDPDAADIEARLLRAARAVCDFYIENTPTDGVPYWDSAAPNLHRLKDYLDRPADPFNDWEPVDSSAAAVAAQALLRLGRFFGPNEGRRYFQAGLTVMKTLLNEPYLCVDPMHHGLVLHAVYHRPNGWDYVPPGARIPYGESCMWGDYHVREAALLLQRLINDEPYYAFWKGLL